MREVLAWLRERSVPSAILSNHMTEAIAAQLERLDLTKYFGQILANTELGATVSGNNKIERMRDYLAGTQFDPSGTIIVGDSPEDIEIGKTLGMRTVAIGDGYFSTPRLRASKPDYLILDSLKTHDFSRAMWEKLCFSCTERLSVFLVKHNESGIPSSHKPAVLTAGIQRRCDRQPKRID